MDQASVDAYQPAREGERRRRLSISAASRGSAATATSAPPSAPRSFAQLRSGAAVGGPQGISRPRREQRRRRPSAEGAGPGRRRSRLHPADLAPGRIRSRRKSCNGREASSASFDPNGVQIVTGDQFTDTGLEARTDLDQYRILHFATHGVVTARAAKCAAQPALLTSFGGNGSDGLLTFRRFSTCTSTPTS